MQYDQDVPGCRSQSSKKSLKGTEQVFVGVRPDEDEIYQRKDNESVDDQTTNDGRYIQTEGLQLGNWVFHANYLCGHQEQNADWGIPANENEGNYINPA